MQRVNFIYDAKPAPGTDPDDIRAQASEILEIGWFAQDQFPETVPDGSGEILRRLEHPSLPRLVVTDGLAEEDPQLP